MRGELELTLFINDLPESSHNALGLCEFREALRVYHPISLKEIVNPIYIPPVIPDYLSIV